MRPKSGSVARQQHAAATNTIQNENRDETRVTKRKRRSSKPNDKKYTCPQQGCGKIYSRAEHLYRHQLNHNPTQIYHCDFEGCDRQFFRQDLCTRHRERHNKESSHLFRKHASNQKQPNVPLPESSTSHSDTRRSPPGEHTIKSVSETVGPGIVAPMQMSVHKSSLKYDPILVDPQLSSPNPDFGSITQAKMFSKPNIEGNFTNEDIKSKRISGHMSPPSGFPSGYAGGQQSDTLNTERSHSIQNSGKSLANVAGRSAFPSCRSNVDIYQLNPSHSYFNPSQLGPLPTPNQSYVSLTSTSSIGSAPLVTSAGLSSNGFPFSANMPSMGARSDSVTSYMTKGVYADPYMGSGPPSANLPTTSISNDEITDMMIPVFNSESYELSAFTMSDNSFFPWLFEDNHDTMYPSLTQPLSDSLGSALVGSHGDMEYPIPAPQSQPPLEIVKTSEAPQVAALSEDVLSEERRQSLLHMILQDFQNNRHAHVAKQGETALQGDHDQASHVLSLRMLRAYIRSYWVHVHPQLPILHKPTFSAATCPDLLLISVMILGASCLEPSYGYELTQQCTELSFFLAWHTRHMIFEDPDFLPPAKLWVFQALLLLEVFEKMFSTTVLHQRAHVHHSTTLTLMRRGSSLTGRAAYDFPPYDNDPTRTPPGPNGSINTAGRNTSDEWWNAWISLEATHRTAFAAFTLDSMHATMFGHSAVMVAHELRIPLPCDEALWSNPKGSEVRRIEEKLALNACKPLGFLEALKRTLNSQTVPTNTFGRVILMSGLCNVSWYMKMQDVRAKSIGVGRQDGWREQLEHAFDFWKRDFDATLAKNHDMFLHDRHSADVVDKDKDFESRTVLHHLAHLAINVDMVDCQILAGAKRSLGRVITIRDTDAVRKRMKESWAPSRHAREATFHALRFLSAVLLPEDDGSINSPQTRPLRLEYSARDDNLVNRPWVLYFATLVVWSYGYCMDGPIVPPSPTYTLPTHELQFRDMQIFLRRVGGIKSPDELQDVKLRNGCLGMLMLLRDLFGKTRWELLHEASDLLGSCIELLLPGISNG